MSQQNIKVIQSRLQQLSLMLDEERLKTERLTIQLAQEKSKVAELEQQIQQTYNAKNSSVLGLSLAKQQVTDLKLREGVHERTINKLDTQLQQSERERNRLNEKIILMQQEYNRSILSLKEALFQKQKELSIKQRQLHTVKSQNLQLSKQTFNLKEKIHTIAMKTEKQHRRINGQLAGFRKEIENIRSAFLDGIQKQKESITQSFTLVTDKLKMLQASLKDKQEIKNQNIQLKKNIEELVTENSRMVIEIYALKQAEYE